MSRWAVNWELGRSAPCLPCSGSSLDKDDAVPAVHKNDPFQELRTSPVLLLSSTRRFRGRPRVGALFNIWILHFSGRCKWHWFSNAGWLLDFLSGASLGRTWTGRPEYAKAQLKRWWVNWSQGHKQRVIGNMGKASCLDLATAPKKPAQAVDLVWMHISTLK